MNVKPKYVDVGYGYMMIRGGEKNLQLLKFEKLQMILLKQTFKVEDVYSIVRSDASIVMSFYDFYHSKMKRTIKIL